MNIMKKTAIIAAIATVVGGMVTVKSFATDVQAENILEAESQNSQEINVEQESYKGKIYQITKQTNLYSIPSFSSAHKTEILENAVVNVEEELNNWIQISFEGSTGWILKTKATKVESQEPVQEEIEEEQTEEEVQTPKVLNKVAFIGVTKANIREKNSIDSSVIGRLEQDTEITLLEELDGWYKIKSESIAEGYISKDLVVTTKPVSRGDDTDREENTVSEEKNTAVNEMLKQEKVESTTVAPTSSNGNSVVEFAKQYLGYKYVSGGKSPSSGFDCSGFTSYVYKKFGVTLGATAASQTSVGTAVDKANLQPGDLLIFQDSSKTKVGHVGIYIGGGQFIHAANAKKGVITTSLSMGYYAERYVGARRVV